ncbi:MAG: hypothetical protein QOK37_803 [Thermoanaerobaculia bacterium]|jgi:hypothetical protein|nr:hypothetical protein [Thermoanaerobaculia bacterium]
MHSFRSFSVVLILIAVPIQAQKFLGADWVTQSLSIGEGRATVKMPPDWSIQNDVVVFSNAEKSDCRIDLAPVRRINFDQRLTRALDEDRTEATGDIHAELYHGPNGVRVVSVHYGDRNGRAIAKRYFDLSTQDGGAIMEWVVNASPTPDGFDCLTRFSMMMATARLSPAENSQTASPN